MTEARVQQSVLKKTIHFKFCHSRPMSWHQESIIKHSYVVSSFRHLNVWLFKLKSLDSFGGFSSPPYLTQSTTSREMLFNKWENKINYTGRLSWLFLFFLIPGLGHTNYFYKNREEWTKHHTKHLCMSETRPDRGLTGQKDRMWKVNQ